MTEATQRLEREKALRAKQAAQLVLKRREAQRSLLSFTRYTFPEFETSQHHECIIDALQRVEAGLCRRLIIQMPPRHGKSELASRRFPAWFMGKHPNEPLITASYGQELSSDFGREVRNIVNSPEYNSVFNNIKLSTDASAAHKWKIEGHRGEYFAVGIGTATTGRGAKILLIDDPHKNREEADSVLERQRVWDWYRSTAFTRLMPQGAIVLIMTRWHDDDLAGRLLKQAEEDPNIPPWEVLSLPAEAEENDPLGRALGEPLWPEWYNKADLMERRAVLGHREYMALYQQQPTTNEGNYFSLEWFKEYTRDTLPPRHELRFYGCSDYATSERRGTDWTVHTVFAIDMQDNIYVMAMWRERKQPKEWIENCIDLMAKYKPTAWAEERGQILNSVGPFLTERMRERGVYCHREQFTPSRDKTVRARAIQGRAEMGMIYFPRHAPWRADAIDELIKFPSAKHDDIVDTFSLLGLMLEKLRGGKAPKPPKEDLSPRNYSFDELLKRSARKARGRRNAKEAPIAGFHGAIDLSDDENYWTLTDE
jgi:predicted phage terminase large subunit-like protein